MQSELVVKISASVEDFNNKLKQVESSTKDLSDKLSGIGAGASIAFAGITLAIGGAIAEFSKQEQAELRTQAVLKSTGEVAGVTATEVNNLASALQKTTVFGDETIISAENMLLTFKNIGKDIFPDVTKAVLDMATAMGQDLQSTAIQVGKAMQDPIAGATALRRVGVQLSESQKAQIESFMDLNNIAGAQAIILKELQSEFGGASEASAKGTGQILQLKNAVGEVSEAIGKKLFDSLSTSIVALKEFAFRLSENEGMTSAMANILKYGAILAGTIATLTAVGYSVIKLNAIIMTANTVFLGGAISASAFWTAVTGPIGLAIAGLVAVGGAIAYLYSQLKEPTQEVSLSKVNEQLYLMKKELKEIGNDNNTQSLLRKKELNDEIEKLEELRKKKIEVGETDTSKSYVEKSSKGATSLELDLPTKEMGLEDIQIPKLKDQQLKNKLVIEKEQELAILNARKEAEKKANEEIKKEREKLMKDLVDAGKTEEQHINDQADRRLKMNRDAEKILLKDKNLAESDKLKIKNDANKLEELIYEDHNQKMLDLIVKQSDKELELAKQKENKLKEILKDFSATPFDIFTDKVNGMGEEERKNAGIGAGVGLASQVAGGKEGARSMVTGLGKAGANMILPGLGEVAGPLLEAFTKGPEATKQMVKDFTDALPEIITAFIEAIPEFVIAFSDAIPVIIDRLTQKLPEIIGALIHALPRVIESLVMQTPKIIAGIIKNIPELISAFVKGFISAIPNIVSGFIDGLVNGAGRFVQALIDAINPFSGGGIMGKAGGFVSNVIGSVGDFFGFAEGGQAFAKSVPSGYANDTYNAHLTTGELVVDNSTAKGLREFINGQGKADVNTNILGQILNAVQSPIEVSTSVNLNQKAFADIILQLNRTNARLA